jgi:hypothetical protein
LTHIKVLKIIQNYKKYNQKSKKEIHKNQIKISSKRAENLETIFQDHRRCINTNRRHYAIIFHLLFSISFQTLNNIIKNRQLQPEEATQSRSTLIWDYTKIT